MSDDIRRNMALFPIGIVMKLTDLTARQIRYYEQHGLIEPTRTSGNQRLFSFNDVERLLEVKALIEKGVNIAGIRQVLASGGEPAPEASPSPSPSIENKRRELTDSQLHQMLKQQLRGGRRPGQVSLIQGELTRFFPKRGN